MKCLFKGGPVDGEMIEVGTIPSPYHYVAITGRPPSLRALAGDAVPPVDPPQVAVYRRIRLNSEERHAWLEYRYVKDQSF